MPTNEALEAENIALAEQRDRYERALRQIFAIVEPAFGGDDALDALDQVEDVAQRALSNKPKEQG